MAAGGSTVISDGHPLMHSGRLKLVTDVETMITFKPEDLLVGKLTSRVSQVVQAFKILTSDKQVKAILVNIFGEPPSPRPTPPFHHHPLPRSTGKSSSAEFQMSPCLSSKAQSSWLT
jgi:hypothetical protein